MIKVPTKHNFYTKQLLVGKSALSEGEVRRLKSLANFLILTETEPNSLVYREHMCSSELKTELLSHVQPKTKKP